MTAATHRTRAYWRLSRRLLTARPRLAIAAGAGLAVALGAALAFPGLRPTACAIAGWNVFCLFFLLLVLRTMFGAQSAEIRLRAAQQDEGQGLILALMLAACAASVAAIALELSLARGEHGALKAAHVAIAFVTVGASWLVMQVLFALHYAHEYYAPDPITRGDSGGLLFPGGEPPDYWDFLHFSIVIGVAAQTADIAFSDRRLRRLGTLHSLVAFAFNTLIVALTINLLAGLF